MAASDWLTLVNVILTALYVILTLSLVIITRRSLALAREQVEEAKIQSQKDREESARQSQAALEASAKQSQEAIEAIREQIKASERQAQEALHNQYRPVLVPLGDFIVNGSTNYSIMMGNKGPGVALNTWGLFTMKNNAQQYTFRKTYFLVPDGEMMISFGGEVQFITNSIAGHNIHLPVDNSFPANGIGGLPVDIRLTVTYNDVFENKYLVIFDHVVGLGWKQDTMKITKTRLDEMVTMKKPLPITQ